MLINHATPAIEHVIVCLTRSGDSQKLLNRDVPIFEMHKPPGNSIKFIWDLARLLRRLKPGIVHCRNWGGADGIIAARLAGINTVIQGEHGWDIGDQDGYNRKRLIIRRLLSRLVRRYSCVSTHMQHWLLDTVGIKKPISHIYNGIDTNVFTPQKGDEPLRQALGIKRSDLVVGTVGRLDPIKNHPLLVDAFKTVSRRFPAARLMIVGDGPEMQHLQRIAGDRISLPGKRDDVPDLMRLFDVYALTSYNEGISNTILEAMACGKPVIATDVGGNPELVQEGITGRLVASGDKKALCKAIAFYFENEEMRLRHGAAARRFVLDRFSIQSMVANYEALYLQAANHRNFSAGGAS